MDVVLSNPPHPVKIPHLAPSCTRCVALHDTVVHNNLLCVWYGFSNPMHVLSTARYKILTAYSGHFHKMYVRNVKFPFYRILILIQMPIDAKAVLCVGGCMYLPVVGIPKQHIFPVPSYMPFCLLIAFCMNHHGHRSLPLLCFHR